MSELHPPFRPPAHEFHLFGRHVFGAHDSRCSVIFLKPIVDYQMVLTEMFSHRSPRVRSGMLDVSPIMVHGSVADVGIPLSMLPISRISNPLASANSCCVISRCNRSLLIA